jgi:hypothetical protein
MGAKSGGTTPGKGKMKRIVLILLLLGAGSAVFCASRRVTADIQQDLADCQAALSAQRDLLVRAEAEKQQLALQGGDLKLALAGNGQGSFASLTATGTSVPGPDALSPDASEQLLAALGFSWNTTGDFVVVSKQTLTNISLVAIKDQKLTAAACGVLAIAPEERAKMEGLIWRISAQYDSWALAHYQRDEPGGNVVAKYELPLDPAFSSGISNQFMAGTTEILGAERGRLLANYSVGWMSDVGMQPEINRTPAGPLTIGPLVLTVTLENTFPGPGFTDHSYMFALQQGAIVNLSNWYITPKEALPVRFRPLFPNGWPDLAKREGFELPRAFSNPPSPP